MTQLLDGLLDGVVVLDLGDEPAARAARVLADLGATVVRVVPPAGDVLTGNRARAWNAGKAVQALAADDPAFDQVLRYAAPRTFRAAHPPVHGRRALRTQRLPPVEHDQRL